MDKKPNLDINKIRERLTKMDMLHIVPIFYTSTILELCDEVDKLRKQVIEPINK